MGFSRQEYWSGVQLTSLQWTLIQPLKKNEIMSLAAMRMDLEIIILSKVRQSKTNICYHLCVEAKKKNDTNEPIYKTEVDSQT